MRRLLVGYADVGGFDVAFTQAQGDPMAPIQVWVRRIRRCRKWSDAWCARWLEPVPDRPPGQK